MLTTASRIGTKPLGVGLLTLSVLGWGCGDRPSSIPEGGASVHVLFDERHGLEGGELVRLHEFDIGFIETVGLSGSRVRATISLSPEALANLTTATTFLVQEDDGGVYLETHVLDPDAEPLADGASVDGADGRLELMAMRASAMAGELAGDARSSEWWRKASEFIDDVREGLDDVEPTEQETELRREWEEIVDRMDEAAEEGREELGRRVDELERELDEAGRSEEARELRERYERFVEELPDPPSPQ